jgi:NAD(P)-dependent dehydrogenase (short-subunit alcohol dehydrogenase family)
LKESAGMTGQVTKGRLTGEVALITGGSRGIGRAMALLFAAEGARVVITARDKAHLQGTVNEITAQGGQSLGIVCDVIDSAAVNQMAREAVAVYGHIDILVNNAGYFPELHPIAEMSDEEWDRTLRANLSSAFYVSRAILPGMIEQQHGSVIMVSSTAAKLAYGLGTPYSAAKAGMLGLTRALAGEGGPHGVRVNALVPGLVRSTEMHHKVNSELQRAVGLKPEDRLSSTKEASLLKKLLEPEDVARAALFLASEDSAAITGQTMNVDAGIRWD